MEGIAQLKFKNYQKAKECGEKVKALAEEIFGYEDEQVNLKLNDYINLFYF